MEFAQGLGIRALGQGMSGVLQVGMQLLEEQLKGGFGGMQGVHGEIVGGVGRINFLCLNA